MKNKDFKIKVFKKIDYKNFDFFLNKILFLEKKCFPKSWQYKDEEARKYYGDRLIDQDKAINFFIYHKDEIIGFMLVILLDKEIFNEIKISDRKIKFVDKCFYIDTIQILPDFRGFGLSKMFFNKFYSLLKNKKIKKFSVHARIKNFLNLALINFFCPKGFSLIERRYINKWKHGGGENYEYLLFEL